MVKANWAGDVLGYWFGALKPGDWYATKAETDETIRSRFLSLWQQMRLAIPASVFLEPEPALAATIVFDQFPRNMFRKQAEAFSTDPLALAIAHNSLRRGFPDSVTPEQRAFLLMPLMHSESLDDQQLCVKVFDGTGNAKYAVEHRDIVARFGRFPHRNRALGRETTEAERQFLGDHEGFGQ